MKFYKEKGENFLFEDTKISNIFIHDILPLIPNSNYVKIYLFGLLAAEQDDIFITNEDIAKKFDYKIEEVLSAWTFFEEIGVIKKKYISKDDTTNYDVHFVDLRNELFFPKESLEADNNNAVNNNASNAEISNAENNLNESTNITDNKKNESQKETTETHVNHEIDFPKPKRKKNINVKMIVDEINKITGKIISINESKKLVNYIDDFSDDPEVLLEGYRYFSNKGKLPKIELVVKEIYKWHNLGYITLEEIREHIKSEDKKTDDHKKIAYLLGMGGILTEPEIEIFDTWLNDYKLTVDDISHYARKAAGISRKFNYVKKIIESDFNSKTIKKKKTKNLTKEEEKILSKEKELEKRRRENQKILNDRIDEIYGKSEEIKKINSQIISNSIELSQLVVSDSINKDEKIDKLNDKISVLEKRKEDILAELGYDKNYLNEIFTCDKCKDTGVLDNGASCDCVLK